MEENKKTKGLLDQFERATTRNYDWQEIQQILVDNGVGLYRNGQYAVEASDILDTDEEKLKNFNLIELSELQRNVHISMFAEKDRLEESHGLAKADKMIESDPIMRAMDRIDTIYTAAEAQAKDFIQDRIDTIYTAAEDRLVENGLGYRDEQGDFNAIPDAVSSYDLKKLSTDELAFLEEDLKEHVDRNYSLEVDLSKSTKAAREVILASPEHKALDSVRAALPPTEKQLEYAEKIASRGKVEIPKDALKSKSAMRKFLYDHTPQPSRAQRQTASGIAKRKKIELPERVMTDTRIMRSFLNEHVVKKSKRVGALSRAKASSAEMSR